MLEVFKICVHTLITTTSKQSLHDRPARCIVRTGVHGSGNDDLIYIE